MGTSELVAHTAIAQIASSHPEIVNVTRSIHNEKFGPHLLPLRGVELDAKNEGLGCQPERGPTFPQ